MTSTANFLRTAYMINLNLQVRYELYDPTVQNIQVLRLEKRLDDKLFYLRDALPEYSTFSFDMDPEILPEGTPVPTNPVQVRSYNFLILFLVTRDARRY